MSLRALARGITEAADRETAVKGFVPCSEIKIGGAFKYIKKAKKKQRVNAA